MGVVLKLGVSDKNIDEHLKAYFGGRLVAEVFSIEEVPLQCNGKLDREKFLNKYKDHRITGASASKYSCEMGKLKVFVIMCSSS